MPGGLRARDRHQPDRCYLIGPSAALGRYEQTSIATPMHICQLCVVGVAASFATREREQVCSPVAPHSFGPAAVGAFMCGRRVPIRRRRRPCACSAASHRQAPCPAQRRQSRWAPPTTAEGQNYEKQTAALVDARRGATLHSRELCIGVAIGLRGTRYPPRQVREADGELVVAGLVYPPC